MLLWENTYHASWTANPDVTAFNAVLARVQSDLSSMILASCIIRITFKFDTSPGAGLASTSMTAGGTGISWANWLALYQAQPTDAVKAAAFATLPTSDPLWGVSHLYQLPPGLDCILRSIDLNTSVNPISIAISSAISIDATSVDGSSCDASKYCLYRLLMHEVTEVLGRVSRLPNFQVGPIDMFSFSASGTREFTGLNARYFSIDNGVTNLGDYRHSSGEDFCDWENTVSSSFTSGTALGDLHVLRQQDVKLLAAIGMPLTSAGQVLAGLTPVTRKLGAVF
jgi:hypothetical protein